MCALSFIPGSEGFLLGMNRDEEKSRPVALPPKLFVRNGVRSIYPSEPGGGTWIGINESGLTAALINWYAVTQPSERIFQSRGKIIPLLLAAEHATASLAELHELPLIEFRPFRLLLIDASAQAIAEQRWDGHQLSGLTHLWRRGHWFSSGYDEPKAVHIRTRTAEAFRPAEWDSTALRELHASHTPEPGPFSICMHRHDAETVSYTEVALGRDWLTLRYTPGAPCRESRLLHTESSLELPRRR